MTRSGGVSEIARIASSPVAYIPVTEYPIFPSRIFNKSQRIASSSTITIFNWFKLTPHPGICYY